MPTYEYACRSCARHLEVVQSFSDAPLTVCEACGGDLRKVFSAAGLIFKGSGWHVKDYSSSARGPGKPASEGSDGASATSTDSGSSSPATAPAASSTTTASSTTSAPSAPSKD
jgi:putative FmdB family regulatory protein